MKIRPAVLFSLLFLCIAAVLPAWGRKESSPPKGDADKTAASQEEIPEYVFSTRPAAESLDETEAEPLLVVVSGIVRLVGNSPFSEIVITGEGRDWYIAREEESKLFDLQQETITVQGFETVRELKFASGISAGERRTLKDIEIISVE